MEKPSGRSEGKGLEIVDRNPLVIKKCVVSSAECVVSSAECVVVEGAHKF